MKLSKNFSLREFTKSATAQRDGIDNNPTEEHLQNLKDLCKYVLQPLRDAIGSSIRISSGYRSKALNKALKGASSTSDHCKGLAADLELWIDGKEDNAKLYNAIRSLNLPFQELIWEFGDETQPSWVHVTYNKFEKEQELLQAKRVNGKVKYYLKS